MAYALRVAGSVCLFIRESASQKSLFHFLGEKPLLRVERLGDHEGEDQTVGVEEASTNFCKNVPRQRLLQGLHSVIAVSARSQQRLELLREELEGVLVHGVQKLQIADR